MPKPTAVNAYRDLLQEYAGISNQIKLELVDVDRNPSVAAQNEVRSYGETVIRHKGRTERVTSTQEQDITNALIKVVSGQARSVYFTQGHGEKDPVSSEVGGYNEAQESLKREKDDAREVREGLECGIKLGGFNDLKEGDILEAYKVEEVARTF